MAKDPALLFYPSDFLTGTMFMSNEQVGIYIRLLCAQHQHGGLIDKPSFNSMVGLNEVVRVKFIETEDGFFNERLMLELDKRAKKSSNLSANAKIRWDRHKKKKSKGNAIALQMDMPTVNEDVNVNKKKKERVFVPPTLEEFKQYFISEGFNPAIGERAWKGYNEADWHKSNGDKIKNWKQTCQNVWFKEENRVKGIAIKETLEERALRLRNL